MAYATICFVIIHFGLVLVDDGKAHKAESQLKNFFAAKFFVIHVILRSLVYVHLALTVFYYIMGDIGWQWSRCSRFRDLP